MSALLALLACWLGGLPGWAASIERVEVGHGCIGIRFDRGLLDAARLMLAMPRPERAAPGPDGPDEPGGTRIMLDLARPAVTARGVLGADGPELSLALGTAEDAVFARAAAEDQIALLPPFNIAAVPLGDYAVSIAVPPARHRQALPRIYGTAGGRPLVVIDPGHGGIDAGAVSPAGDRREKDLTLRIAEAIRRDLVASGRVRVALTREDDRFLPLQERYGLARALHADLFISIHCDSVASGDASGATVYTLSEVASDKESARLAARENKADLAVGANPDPGGADVASILIDLTRRETMNRSARFAGLLAREAQPLMPVSAHFHRMASLVVLKAPDMPSVLFETGYISNPTDAAFIDSDKGRGRIAESVRRAVEIHFARRLAADD